MYGQMTAGSWIYIGSQGIVQGTYETFVAAGRRHFGGNLEGRLIVSAGMGGMGGAQPLAATMTGARFWESTLIASGFRNGSIAATATASPPRWMKLCTAGRKRALVPSA